MLLIEKQHEYARLLLTEGVALQQDQPLLINGEVESANFIRILVQEAYALGASDVHVNWRDGLIGKERLLHAKEEILSNPKPWVPEFYHNQLDANVAVISLVSANPTLLAGVPSDRIALQSRSLNKILKFYHEAVMSSAIRWCVAAVPTLLWANELGFTGTDEEKLQTLWFRILELCRVHEITEENGLHAHLERLSHRTEALNNLRIKSFHYTAPNGTDLHVEFPTDHLWQGGSEKAKDDIVFTANIPTEEVFTAPHRLGVNGTVHSTKPLIYQGNRINNFSLTFESGTVVSFTAEEGYDVLKTLLETDEGAARLGEVALVDHFSPISQSNTIYFETLFDENASCHLAFGASYPTTLTGAENLSEEELLAVGMNDSLVHVDFMIGHEQMNITALTQSGESVAIMKEGKLLL